MWTILIIKNCWQYWTNSIATRARVYFEPKRFWKGFFRIFLILTRFLFLTTKTKIRSIKRNHLYRIKRVQLACNKKNKTLTYVDPNQSLRFNTYLITIQPTWLIDMNLLVWTFYCYLLLVHEITSCPSNRACTSALLSLIVRCGRSATLAQWLAVTIT